MLMKKGKHGEEVSIGSKILLNIGILLVVQDLLKFTMRTSVFMRVFLGKVVYLRYPAIIFLVEKMESLFGLSLHMSKYKKFTKKMMELYSQNPQRIFLGLEYTCTN